MKIIASNLLVLCVSAWLNVPVGHAQNVQNPLYLIPDKTAEKSKKHACKDYFEPNGALEKRDLLLCVLHQSTKSDTEYSPLPVLSNAPPPAKLLVDLVPCAKPSSEDREIANKTWIEDKRKAQEALVAQIRAAKDSEGALQNLKNYSEPQKGSLYEYDDVLRRCHKAAQGNIKAPDLRFAKKEKALYQRQSLLALFQSAEYGKRNGYVVLRQDWSTPFPDGSKVEAKTFRPLVNQLDDDVALIRFLYNKPSFEVSKETEILRLLASDDTIETATNVTLPSGETVLKPIMTGYASPFDRVWSVVSKADDTIEIENPPSILPTIWEPKTNKATLQLAVLASSAEFAKSADKQEGAKIGTTRDGSGDGSVLEDDKPTITADIAIGLPYKWSREFGYTPSRFVPEKIDFTVTPFLSVDAAPQTVTRLVTLNGETTTPKQVIDAATIAAGIRFDYEQTSKRITPSDRAQGSNYLSVAGRDIPGWRYALVYEGLTDNYNLWSAQRAALELSPPSVFLTPGYRSAFPLDAFSRDPIAPNELEEATKRNWIDGFTNGWYFEWDGAVALDYIDYSRLPRKLGEDYPNLIRDDVPEFGLYGGNLELKLTKRNLFGTPKNDYWASFEVDYTYREGFESQTRTTNHVELSLKLSDPQNSKRFIGLTYKDGFNYRTQEEDDQIGFEIGAKY